MDELSWHLITGKSLDFKSSIGAYTLNLSQGMAKAGCRVHLWISGALKPSDLPGVEGCQIQVHRVSSLWGRRAFHDMEKGLESIAGRKRFLIQFAPDSFGDREWNLTLPGWLAGRRDRGDELWLMVHKTYKPGWKIWRPGRWLVTVLQKHMLRKTMGVCQRVFVSTLNLTPYLEELRADGFPVPFVWLPVPSNVPRIKNKGRVRNLRKAFGHGAPSIIGTFGSYRDRSFVRLLRIVVPKLLQGHPGRVWLCLGRDSEVIVKKIRQENPGIASQIELAGELDPEALSAHIQVCDVMLQPYPKGVDTSRTSVMVGLSHHKPVVTTHGPGTEKIWRQTGSVCLCPGDRPDVLPEAISWLLEDEQQQKRLAECGGETYEACFSLETCIRTLLSRET